VKKKVLVTGAAGFIGYHVSQALRRRGDFVIGLDNFNDYYSPQLKRDREALLKEEGIDIVEGDICDKEKVEGILRDNAITHVIHLAAQAGVRYSLENPDAYISSNIQGFVSVLEACRSVPGIKFVYASSSSVYGRNTKVPFSIEDRVDNQASLYGATKKSNELIADVYHHLYGIPVVGLRFFTVYGPWGRPDMAYYSFMRKILEGETLPLFNYGKMRRDFTYIDDIVDGVIASVDADIQCEVFNLGNNTPHELGYFVALLEKYAGREVKKELLPMQKGDVFETYADITYSQKILGFTPRVTLEEGLQHFARWYCEYHSQPVEA
jgi:UDP-glucuronate 4-epimerase